MHCAVLLSDCSIVCAKLFAFLPVFNKKCVHNFVEVTFAFLKNVLSVLNDITAKKFRSSNDFLLH